MSPYDNERKSPAVNIEDAKKIMEMIWHRDTETVRLSGDSDNRIIGFYRYNGEKEPDITTKRGFYDVPPQPLEDLVFRLLEKEGYQFIVKAGEECRLCGDSSYGIILTDEPD